MYKLEYSTNLYNKMQNYAMFLIPKKTSLLADRIYFDVHLGNVKKKHYESNFSNGFLFIINSL